VCHQEGLLIVIRKCDNTHPEAQGCHMPLTRPGDIRMIETNHKAERGVAIGRGIGNLLPFRTVGIEQEK
jgi:hypothetical protein